MSAMLTGVNRTPAQTWNWLKTNECQLVVPAAPAADPQTDVPAAARRIECGAGAEATQWLDASATSRRCIVVPAGARSQAVEVLLDTCAGTVAQTSVFARPGSEVAVNVVAAEGLACEAAPAETRAHAAANEAAARDAAAVGGTEGADAPVTSGHVLRIHAEAGSHVTVTLLVAADATHNYLDSLGITADDNAEVTVRQYVIGAGICALGTQVDLVGDKSRLDLTLRYLGDTGEKIDFGYNVPVLGRKARANLDMTGVLTGNAEKALRTVIDLKHGCKGAKGTENETVLVAGDDVVNKTLPTILCDEDDVEGNHGAAIGSVSPEQLSYLADRGLSEDEVYALFRRAIVDDAATTLPGAAPSAVVGWAQGALGTDAAAEIADSLELGAGVSCAPALETLAHAAHTATSEEV